VNRYNEMKFYAIRESVNNEDWREEMRREDGHVGAIWYLGKAALGGAGESFRLQNL
jgi:hypothetical protein